MNKRIPLAAALFLFFITQLAQAAPKASILRIDPRAGMSGGAPILTTIIDLVQFNPLSDALAPCSNVTGYNDTLDCWSNAVESDKLWTPIGTKDGKFPPNALFTVAVGMGTKTAKLEGEPVKWGQSKDAIIGTAWLIALDASNGMGARYQDAREVAHHFIEAMGPNDLVDVVIFDDRDGALVDDSKWKTYKDRIGLVGMLDKYPNTSPSRGQNRSLASQLEKITASAFGSLGNVGSGLNIPAHQALVVLSNGAGRGDPGSAAPAAKIFRDFANKGRFPDDNSAAPKTPLPIISIWFPNPSGLQNDLYRTNDSQFMQGLANPEIGGFFDIVRQGQGSLKEKAIVAAVKKRFNAMWVVKWRLACLNLSPAQTFNLTMGNLAQGDGTFKEVPIGVDPTQWPLDIDVARTKADAEANPVHPGGTFTVYGDFCWGGDKGRAEAYFVPAGTKPDPSMSNPDPEQVKKAMQSLVQQGMRGEATDVNDVSATFKVPDEEKILEGTGDNMIARVIVYDNGAARASGHDEQNVLTLKAKAKPLNLLLIGAVAGGVVVVVLLLIVLLRGGGGGSGRKRTQPPPAPIVAGGPMPPYGGQPPPYGGAPPPPGYGPPGGYHGGGGYGASPGAATPDPR